MAQGVYDSVAGSPTAALSALTRAAALLETSYRAALLPDTPAALAALVAVHCGEHDVAQSVLERAVADAAGRARRGHPAPAAAGLDRAVPRGRPAAARAALQAASPPGVRAGAARRAAGRRAGGRRWPGAPATWPR